MLYSERKEGFVQLSVLLLVLSLCILIISISALVLADRHLIKSYSEKKNRMAEAEKLCENVLIFFNEQLVREKSDSSDCEALQSVLNNFAEYEIKIEAVSDKLNTSLLKKEILSDKGISAYLFMHPETEGKYGYLNNNLTESSFLDKIAKEYKVKDRSELFPLLNYLPSLNVHNIDEDLIRAVLEYCKVEDSSSKAREIYNKAQSFGGIDYDQLKKIIKARDNSSVQDFLGVKTQMWKVSFSYKDIKAELIIGAVPYRRDKMREVESYRILERRIW